MCLAFPGKIKSIKGKKATVQYPNEVRDAIIAEEGISVGDYVMVQMGLVVKKLSKKEAENSWKAWKQDPI